MKKLIPRVPIDRVDALGLLVASVVVPPAAAEAVLVVLENVKALSNKAFCNDTVEPEALSEVYMAIETLPEPKTPLPESLAKNTYAIEGL